MSDAVYGLVRRVGRHVVEQEHGRPLPDEEMLEAEDLPSVAQGTLSEEPDLGQAVQHDPQRLYTLEHLEDAFGRFPQFQIGRIKQALLLILVQQIFGRYELEQVDA